MLKFLRRTLGVALGLLTLIAIVGIVGLRFWFSRALPQLDGTVELTNAGLDAPVDIYRDEYGVPHIFAQTDADMMFALGYVHAQDRLYQMEFQRRLSSGNLAAMWGEAALPADRFLRTLGFARLAEQVWQHPDALNTQTRGDLSAYARGVNAFIGEGNPLPPEFTIAGLIGGNGELMGPWEETNSLAWLKVMSLDLGANFRRELARLYLATRMEEAQIAEYFAPYPGTDPIILPDMNALFGMPAPDLSTAAPSTAIADVPFGEWPTPSATLGSNNWVIDGSRMENGNSVLANDPHLGLTIPAVWYFAHISSEESGTNAIGATFPGVPTVVIGRNDHIAWGFTNTGPDVQDLFVERISRSNGKVLTPSGWQPLDIRTETIEVAGQDEPVELTIRESRHGPLISDIIDVPEVFGGEAAAHEYAFALQWTANLPGSLDTSANSAAASLRSRSYEEFREGMRDYQSPQQNMVVLENETGRIGYIAPGLVPLRDPSNPIQGWAPSPGWDALYDWQGFIPFEELPQADNPAEGYVITANSDIRPEGYPHHITHDWTLPLRHDRIHALTIGQDRPLTMADMEATILDQRINSAAQALPAMLANTDISGLSAEDRDTARAMLDILSTWAEEQDYSGADDLVAPTLFFAWYRDFVYDAVADEFGLDMTAENRSTSMFARLFRFNPIFAENLARGDHPHWCDGQTCGAHLASSLISAHTKLAAELGGGLNSWQWRKLHHARSDNGVLPDNIPVPGRLLKLLTGLQFRIDRPHGGGPDSVNVSGFEIDDATDFRAKHTASLRLLVEAGDFEGARFVGTQGQSGLPQSPHFDDLADLWAAGEFAPLHLDRATIEASAAHRLTLMP